MASQTDRLARIAAEGFAMIDELYGRPNRRPFGTQGQGPQSPYYQGKQDPVPRNAEPVSSQDVVKKNSGFITYKNQQYGF